MKTLLVYPKYPDTFWSWKYILKFVNKRAAFPPLGLLTVAAMLPRDWEIKLVDMNVSKLKDEDVRAADYVFISAMIAQRDSAKEVVERCKKLGIKVVAGGPLFTTGYEEFENIDHFILGETEDIMGEFLADLKAGEAKRIYASDKKPDIAKTPIPLWSLINIKNYVSMSLQYSRGCPFDCEFCDITVMNGRVPRTKSPAQFLAELEAIYKTGFRGSIFIVDDNFIGNKVNVKKMLSELIGWQKKRGWPFNFFTEASIDLADDQELLTMMAEAGFNKVFIGLETPVSASLAECNKFQNKNRDVIASVKKIQNYGIQTMGGFIVGFDNDPPHSVFEDQIKFIQEAGIVVAMVGILQALPKTRLYNRLVAEGRLLRGSSGNNTDCCLNFVPKMKAETLFAGYKKIIKTIYSWDKYCERICIFLKQYKPNKIKKKKITLLDIEAFIKSIWYLGIIGRWKTKKYYWKTILVTFFKYRPAFSEVVAMLIYGAHFKKVADAIIKSELLN